MPMGMPVTVVAPERWNILTPSVGYCSHISHFRLLGHEINLDWGHGSIPPISSTLGGRTGRLSLPRLHASGEIHGILFSGGLLENDRRLLKTIDTTTSSDVYSDVLCTRYSTFVRSGVQASDHIFDWSLESLTRTFVYYEKMYDVTWSLLFQILIQVALV